MNATGPRTDLPRTGSAPLLPGEPLSVLLMNTLWADTAGVHDALADAAGLRVWLEEIAPHLPGGVGDVLPGAAEPAPPVAEFRRLRDALRALAAAATGDSRPIASAERLGTAEAAQTVGRACSSAPTWSDLRWPEGGTPGRILRSAHDPAAAALALIAEDAARLFAGDTLTSLRACTAPGCVLYFVRTHPRRQWCSAGCGNRARVARHYRRHHGHPTA